MFDLNEGLNLISFPFPFDVTIPDAIPDSVGHHFEFVITSGVAASQLNGIWVGSLQSFKAGVGYWVKVDTSLSFSFEYNVDNDIAIAEHKTLPKDFAAQQSTKQAFYFVESIEIDGKPLDEEDVLLAYYNDKIIGSRYYNGAYTDIPVMGRDNSKELMDNIEEGGVPSFKVYKSKTNEYVELFGEIPPFETNQVFMIDYLSGTMIDIPNVYSLAPAYPNPFNPSTTLSFGLPQDTFVNIEVYDLLGKNVTTLVNDIKSAGFHKYSWNAEAQASGVYFIVMNAGKFTQKQKILLVK